MPTIMERLTQAFRTVFDDDDIQLRHDMTANDVDGWDSLSHVNLITMVETTFRITFNQKELLRHRNVGDLVADIERKLAAA